MLSEDPLLGTGCTRHFKSLGNWAGRSFELLHEALESFFMAHDQCCESYALAAVMLSY